MRRLFSLGVCGTVALIEATCFFNIWLNLDIDSYVIPYVAAISCLIMFLSAPYTFVNYSVRFFLDRRTPRGKSLFVCAMSVILSVLLGLCWLLFARIVLDIYQDDYLVAEDMDRFCFYAPYVGMIVEALALPLLFVKIKGGGKALRKPKAPKKPKAPRRKKGSKLTAEGAQPSSADSALNTNTAFNPVLTAADTAADTNSPPSVETEES